MPDTAVSTHALVKRYRDVTAVDSLNLDVRRGEIYGFLGRNGAGKTTTIRMLLGLIRPSSGDVSVLGRRIRPGETSVFSRVGFLVETATAYPNLTVHENLDIQRRLTGSPPRSVADSIALLRLDPYASRRAGQLSLGNKQRLALARAPIRPCRTAGAQLPSWTTAPGTAAPPRWPASAGPPTPGRCGLLQRLLRSGLSVPTVQGQPGMPGRTVQPPQPLPTRADLSSCRRRQPLVAPSFSCASRTSRTLVQACGP